MREDEGTGHQVKKRVQRVQAEIMENEALADALDEEGASELLSWGLKGAEGIAFTTDGMDDEAADLSMAIRLKALRKLMRHLGRLLGEGNDLDSEGRIWLWDSIQKHSRLLYGENSRLPTLDDVMGRLSQGETPGQIIASLRNLFDN